MTQAPNDSLPSPASLARSLGYAFVGGATVALVLTLIPNSADTNETGLLSLVALAYAVGLLCLRAEDRLPTWATPAALALATILVTYAVEFFSRSDAERVGDLLRRRRPPGRPIPEPLVGRRAGGARRRRVRLRHVGPRGRARGVARDGRDGRASAAWMVGTMRVRVRRLIIRLADAARTDAHTGLLNRRGLHGDRRARARARAAQRPPVSIVVVDIDRFQDFNEQHGHRASDRALKAHRHRPAGEQAADRRRGAHQRRGVRADRSGHRRARRLRARRQAAPRGAGGVRRERPDRLARHRELSEARRDGRGAPDRRRPRRVRREGARPRPHGDLQPRDRRQPARRADAPGRGRGGPPRRRAGAWRRRSTCATPAPRATRSSSAATRARSRSRWA